MSMNAASITPRERAKAAGAGAILGMIGMSAYHLPVTKDRFVRSTFNIVKNQAEENIEMLNESALAISKNKLKDEHKLFLSQLGVSENIASINNKIAELKKSITDSDMVKALKKGYADSFSTFKKSEALMDPVASKAFQRIRWNNFGWGAVIGFIAGSVIAMKVDESSQVPPNMY